MYLDDTIIARQSTSAGGLCVLAHADEVQLRDGGTLKLHTVFAHGMPMPALRALDTTSGRLVLLDMGHVAPNLANELRDCPRRDIAGYVLFTLRQHFATVAQFHATAQRVSRGSWWPVGDGYVWQAAPRAVDAQVLRHCDTADHTSPVPDALLAAAAGAAC